MVRYWRPLSIGRSGSWWVRSFVSSSPGLGQLSPQIPTRKVLLHRRVGASRRPLGVRGGQRHALLRRWSLSRSQIFMLRRAGLVVFVSAVLASCAGMGLHESLRVNLAGLESIPGAGMEARFLAKVRVQNPNDVSITYTGLSAELDLNGKSFASGVSDATGEIPRFGESLIEIPLTVPATAIVRQVLGLISGDRSKATHHVRGFLNTGTFGRAPFDSTGEIELPKLASSSS